MDSIIVTYFAFRFFFVVKEEEKTLTLRPFAGNTPFRRFDSNQTRMTEDNSNTPIRRFDSNQTTISGMTEDDNKTVVDASQKETLCHRYIMYFTCSFRLALVTTTPK